jgi:hypothetical protein
VRPPDKVPSALRLRSLCVEAVPRAPLTAAALWRLPDPSGLIVVDAARAPRAPFAPLNAPPLAAVTEPSALRTAPRPRTAAPLTPETAVATPFCPRTLARFGRASAVIEEAMRLVAAMSAAYFAKLVITISISSGQHQARVPFACDAYGTAAVSFLCYQKIQMLQTVTDLSFRNEVSQLSLVVTALDVK